MMFGVCGFDVCLGVCVFVGWVCVRVVCMYVVCECVAVFVWCVGMWWV